MNRRSLKAFTLIELVLVFAIIGILSAIAIPVYQNFTIRTKVAELLVMASSFKPRITENVLHSGGVIAQAGVGLTVVTGGRVTAGSVTDDGIITVSGTDETLGTAVTLVLTPTTTTETHRVTWTCSTGNTSLFKYVPGECRH